MITTVAVITRLRVYQELLSSLIGSQPGFAVIAICSSEQDATRAVAMQRPDLALVDAALPGVWNVTGAALRASVRVVVFGVVDNPHPIQIAQDAGCTAVLVSTATSNEMLASIEGVRASEPGWQARSTEPAGVASLTARELEVLALVARGMSNKEIAAELVISIPTVKSHVHSLLTKLGARRRSEAGRLLHLAATAASHGVRPAAEPHPAISQAWDDDRPIPHIVRTRR